MKNVFKKETPERLAVDRQAGRDYVLHERVVLCARLARLLRRSLRGFDWAEMRFTDRARLQRVLSGLGADIPLVWLIEGQEYIAGQEIRDQAVPKENKEASNRSKSRVPEKRVCC